MASIQKRPNGKYRARYVDPLTGKEVAKHFAKKTGKGGAQAWLEAINASIVNGTYVAPLKAKTTLTEFHAAQSEIKLWTPGTATAMSLSVRTCTFKDEPFSRLSKIHVEQWVREMVDNGLAPGTIKTRVMNVRGMLRAAVEAKALAEDPTTGVKLPKVVAKRHSMKIPTTEEVAAVIRHAEPWVRTFIALCAFAGLRLGEASALQLSDFDFENQTLKVQRQVQRAPGAGVEIREPKHGSIRDVNTASHLLEMVKLHASEIGVRGVEQWLFTGGDGNPPHQNTIGHQWRKALNAASLPHYRIHDLRHFFASALIRSGCDVVTVQHALGHSSITTTQTTYAHLWPDSADRTRAAADALLLNVMGNPADYLRTDTE